ncbi:DUF461 domain-containing protein [Streptomyces agglomeratus]|uniref:DUF461 domain-containing protein n=1 Tax=Streptomyces agglomeratus TaxID=285458 RepID=A0A1E5P9N5_9ACTN|nr:DUF461 domain-containing protein [Streptomyces agglomeratus]OEJ26273.1 DUF461 domain-containing protein [Streptomyces agglomeratus]OEJ39669.1 DUF461 domain-containing protein [Streptomyces agglomeratus]OEJ45947.1 DUF461 domain-containing protein [Streptomyces agglomeratus]OEJ52230.1 DUF461 domain-containing protein [Streptomyces agglomeratus]OEJ59588.1 DUF461 domain-containing protein [Streptomyces agglomeratus]
MSSSLRRGALAATAIVFSIASLAACGAGNDAQTLGVRPDNAAASVDDIKIQNATIVTQPEIDAEGPAAVTGMIFNNGTKAETLEAVSLPGTSTKVTLKPAKGSGPLTVPAGGSLLLGGKGNASAVIEDGREAAKDGDAQPVRFELSETGTVELRAFVVPATQYFKDVGPSRLPKAPAQSPSGSATASPTGSPAGEAGSTASSSPSQGVSQSSDAQSSDDADEHGAEH